MLEDSEICRILPSGDSGSAVKNRDRPTRPLFITIATCGFVGKNQAVFGGFRFSPQFRNMRKRIRRPEAKTPQHPAVADTSKGRCRKTEQRPFFVIASRRIHDDCITEDILSERPVTLARNDEIEKRGPTHQPLPGKSNRPLKTIQLLSS